jgi:hypothetical protein
MTPNLYTLVPELGTSDVRMPVNIPDQVNGTEHPRFSQWAFSNNIAVSYNMAVNMVHNHTTRAGAPKQFQLSKYFFFIVSDAKLIAAGRILRFFKASSSAHCGIKIVLYPDLQTRPCPGSQVHIGLTVEGHRWRSEQRAAPPCECVFVSRRCGRFISPGCSLSASKGAQISFSPAVFIK